MPGESRGMEQEAAIASCGLADAGAELSASSARAERGVPSWAVEEPHDPAAEIACEQQG